MTRAVVCRPGIENGLPMSEGVLELIRTRAVCRARRGEIFPGKMLGAAIKRDTERTGIDALAVMERAVKERPDLADGRFDYSMSDADYLALRAWVRGLCDEMKTPPAPTP